MAGRGNHAKSVGILGPPGATTLWASNTSVFAIHHLLSALEALCSFIRVGSQGWVLASVFCVHSVAWFCCQKGRSAERARRLQTVASVCGVLSWSLRTLVSVVLSSPAPCTWRGVLYYAAWQKLWQSAPTQQAESDCVPPAPLPSCFAAALQVRVAGRGCQSFCRPSAMERLLCEAAQAYIDCGCISGSVGCQ
jgi:hypothetical protein